MNPHQSLSSGAKSTELKNREEDGYARLARPHVHVVHQAVGRLLQPVQVVGRVGRRVVAVDAQGRERTCTS